MKKILFFGVMAQFVEFNYAQTLSIAFNKDSPSVHSASTTLLKAQGIRWTEGISWREIKELATREQKYIFLDCYATWCGPCKMMDEQVYTNDSVGNYFNTHFVNVKVQMDKTNNDNQYVQNWYNDANVIAKDYRIDAFPSFVFLSPDSKVVHQATGYTGVSQLINMAQMSIEPGRKYESPFSEYDRLLADYKRRIVHYDSMYYMIKTARRVNHAIADELSEKYEKYVATLNNRQRFTKDIIDFLADKISSGESNEVTFFKRHKKKIDQVMRRKGYAAAIIDKAIYNEIVVPFFKEQNKTPILPMTGMYLNGLKPDYSEADWNKLAKMIRRKFNKSITDRNVLSSRIEWYQRHWNIEASCRFKLIELEKYPTVLQNESVRINSYAWKAFIHTADKEILNGYIKWMEKVVHLYKYPFFLDTYANLLYKAGKREEAIEWEEKAVEAANGSEEYKKIVAQMKRGEPTYGVRF